MHALSAIKTGSLRRIRAAAVGWTNMDPELRRRAKALLLFSLGFAICLLAMPKGKPYVKVVSNLGQLGGSLIGAFWAFQASRSRDKDNRPRFLWAPACLGIGILAFVVGQAIWSYYEFFLHK